MDINRALSPSSSQRGTLLLDRDALGSVLKQTITNFECIVVDDGSTDETSQIVELFIDHRFRLIRQDHLGVSSARNRGIQEARMNLSTFLDGDDYWDPSFRKMSQNPLIIQLLDSFFVIQSVSAFIW